MVLLTNCGFSMQRFLEQAEDSFSVTSSSDSPFNTSSGTLIGDTSTQTGSSSRFVRRIFGASSRSRSDARSSQTSVSCDGDVSASRVHGSGVESFDQVCDSFGAESVLTRAPFLAPGFGPQAVYGLAQIDSMQQCKNYFMFHSFSGEWHLTLGQLVLSILKEPNSIICKGCDVHFDEPQFLLRHALHVLQLMNLDYAHCLPQISICRHDHLMTELLCQLHGRLGCMCAVNGNHLQVTIEVKHFTRATLLSRYPKLKAFSGGTKKFVSGTGKAVANVGLGLGLGIGYAALGVGTTAILAKDLVFGYEGDPRLQENKAQPSIIPHKAECRRLMSSGLYCTCAR